tara:strand:- start:142 stop:774 length:633 start_codon:yes stop_codon:yes gene_type:complete
MMAQKIFDYKFSSKKNLDDFFVNVTNQEAYTLSTTVNFDQNIFLYGPLKSGKSHLLNLWKKYNNAIDFKNNFSQLNKLNNNIVIDNVLEFSNEEQLFHLINHCKLFNLKIFATSSIDLINHSFKLKDLYSRFRSFYYVQIKKPDDEMCKMFMHKLFYEKQIIIKNKEIFEYIYKRVNRSYNEIYLFVKKIDQLSLEKKRQLTISLIKEII